MRTLLRDRATGLYFKGPDQWTSDPVAALDFKMIDRAVQFIETWRLRDMELAFAFPRYKQVMGVPVDKIGAKYSEG